MPTAVFLVQFMFMKSCCGDFLDLASGMLEYTSHTKISDLRLLQSLRHFFHNVTCALDAGVKFVAVYQIYYF